MPFSNPIAAGVALIRDALQSPNFLTGVRGWSINKDGTAEFSAGQFRGSVVLQDNNTILFYNGTPGIGTLIFSISGATASGTDQYGNRVPVGLNFNQGIVGGAAAAVGWKSGLFRKLAAGIESAGLFYGESGSGTGTPFGASGVAANQGRLMLAIPAADPTLSYVPAIAVRQDSISAAHPRRGIQFDNGPIGPYYCEEVYFNGGLFAVASSASTTVIPGPFLRQPGHSFVPQDYATAGGGILSCFDNATGVWTCPEDGFYLWNVNIVWQSWVAGSRMVILLDLDNGATAQSFARSDNTPGANAGAPYSLMGMRWIDAGQTVRVRVSQVTGVSQNIVGGTIYSTTFTVRRLL